MVEEESEKKYEKKVMKKNIRNYAKSKAGKFNNVKGK
jgi:hypothetical protein